MTQGREAWEVSEANHLNEILGLPYDTDAEGYYPGEKQYRIDHGLPLDPPAEADVIGVLYEPVDFTNKPF